MDNRNINEDTSIDEFLVTDLVTVIYKSYHHYLMHQLNALNVTRGQIPFIMEIMHSEHAFQSELTEKLFLSRAVTTKTLKKLDEKEIITRKISQRNKRKNEVFLTEKGKEIASKIQKIEEDWDNEICNKFKEVFPDKDNEELKEFLFSIAKISLNILKDDETIIDYFKNMKDSKQRFYDNYPFKGHHFRIHDVHREFFDKNNNEHED